MPLSSNATNSRALFMSFVCSHEGTQCVIFCIMCIMRKLFWVLCEGNFIFLILLLFEFLICIYLNHSKLNLNKCGLCCWAMCEQDYHCSKCEQDLIIELNCVPIILNFKIISNDRNDSKFNISTTLGLKLKKSRPRNPTHQVHSNNIKSLPNLPKILVLILLNFL